MTDYKSARDIYSVRRRKMEEMEINQLAILAKNGNKKAFDVLLKRMEGAVNTIVGKYAVGKGAAYRGDYRQEAYCGIWNCLKSYDEGKGAFVNYALYDMRSHVLDYIRNRQNLVTIGTNMLSNVKKVRAAVEAIREEGLEESVENISLFSGIESYKTVETALWAMKVENSESLDREVKEEEGATFVDFIEGDEEMEEAFLEREEERALLCAIASLPEKDRYIALHSFGIFGAEEMSNIEIAQRLGCTPNTVVNRKKAITARIREALMEWAS